MTAFKFLKDGSVRYTGRFVETEYFLREQAADNILYRNAFGTEKESSCPFQNAFDFDLKNVANTVSTKRLSVLVPYYDQLCLTHHTFYRMSWLGVGACLRCGKLVVPMSLGQRRWKRSAQLRQRHRPSRNWEQAWIAALVESRLTKVGLSMSS